MFSVWLENAYSRPLLWFSEGGGDFTPLNGEACPRNETPKGTTLRGKTSHRGGFVFLDGSGERRDAENDAFCAFITPNAF